MQQHKCQVHVPITIQFIIQITDGVEEEATQSVNNVTQKAPGKGARSTSSRPPHGTRELHAELQRPQVHGVDDNAACNGVGPNGHASRGTVLEWNTSLNGKAA